MNLFKLIILSGAALLQTSSVYAQGMMEYTANLAGSAALTKKVNRQLSGKITKLEFPGEEPAQNGASPSQSPAAPSPNPH